MQAGRLIAGNVVEYAIGSGLEMPCDGCEKTATFVQPTSRCSEGNFLYVTDTGASALKLVSQTALMSNFVQQVRTLYSAHAIHSSKESLGTAIRQMDDVTRFLETAINKAKVNEGGRPTVEGPHGVPSSKPVGSIRMT